MDTIQLSNVSNRGMHAFLSYSYPLKPLPLGTLASIILLVVVMVISVISIVTIVQILILSGVGYRHIKAGNWGRNIGGGFGYGFEGLMIDD